MKVLLKLMSLTLAGGMMGCGTVPDGPESLSKLADEYWEGQLAANPVSATAIGDRRYDHLLSDLTSERRERDRRRLDGVLQRARAIDPDELGPADQLTRLALVNEVEGDLALLDCGLDDWSVDPLNGPQVSFLNIESFQPVRSVEEGRAMAQRWKAMGPYVDVHVSNLRRSLGEGRVATRDAVLKVIEEIEDLLQQPENEWPLLKPLETPHLDWSSEERAEFDKALRGAVRESVRPAMERYGEFLQEELLPRARPQEKPGIVHIPDGIDCYRNLVRVHTSLDLSPEDIHQTGLDEVSRINAEMERLGERVLGTSDRREILSRLRTDPELYFETSDQVAAKAESALRRAQGAVSDWFGNLPKASCEVTRMKKHEEKHSTIAYYLESTVDGSRPGRYYINTSEPRTRPRYEAEALAYHEAVPGHHLQIALTQELSGLPAFRRYEGVTAFVEGWALYAERLADDMGLYSSDLDRMGMLSYEAWRACRLVVDTGMHAKGWSRQQAIDFMLNNTVLAENNIVNEVDRYIVWPAQALAYKIGQLEILRLRGEAESRLGKRFDIKAFHDTVLGSGAVPLESLRHAVEKYVQSAMLD
ncbi:MAG: DUF885 domain-containing protein [Acidobacteriota bacterium]